MRGKFSKMKIFFEEIHRVMEKKLRYFIELLKKLQKIEQYLKIFEVFSRFLSVSKKKT